MHDPTTKNRQGNDAGSQYRSVIFYDSPEQKQVAEKVTAFANEKYAGLVSTTIEPAGTYVRAEEYHQAYLAANPHGYECATHFERSWEKIAKAFASGK